MRAEIAPALVGAAAARIRNKQPLPLTRAGTVERKTRLTAVETVEEPTQVVILKRESGSHTLSRAGAAFEESC